MINVIAAAILAAVRGQSTAVSLTLSMDMKNNPKPIPAISGSMRSVRSILRLPSPPPAMSQTATSAKAKPII